MKTQEENTLRFKTEAEFVKEFGEDWRHTGDKRWNKAMDYLFGLPCNPEWIGKLESIHPEKCKQRGHRWTIREWMVTTDPLAQVQTEAVSQEAPVTKGAFLYACYKGDTEVVAKYIEQGGDVNVRGSLGPGKFEDDPVNRPAHYNQGGIECIEAIRAALTEEEFRGYLKGNALKYIWRERHKGNSEQDVKKAIWYLSKLID
jgi:hypothetical protein